MGCRRSTLALLAVACTVAAAGVATTPASASEKAPENISQRTVSNVDAVPGRDPNPAAHQIADSMQIDNDAQPGNNPPRATAIGCTPETVPDNPHISRTAGVPVDTISGHGFWRKGNCISNTATVMNCLYEYYTDGTYRRKACDTKSGIRAGGGSGGNRTAANRPCDSTGLIISWRNRVDVDVDGEIDTSEVGERQADVACVIVGPDQ